jgi:GT2 family glycosyltransferase
MKKVSIVTVNFNQPGVTEDLLKSLAEVNSYPDLEIIVVDNGSKTNPVPEWQLRYPGILFIRSKVNTGFAGGNNIGIARATGDYLFLINNDTEVTAGLIGKLVNSDASQREHRHDFPQNPLFRSTRNAAIHGLHAYELLYLP